MNFYAIYNRVLQENGLEAYSTPEAAEKFSALLDEMLRVNAFMNLTAVTDPEQIIARHFADSMTCLSYIPEGAKVLDVGTGGGFPSLPIAILRPDVTVTALDSTEKKLKYVQNTAGLLGLSNLSTLYARAEEAGNTALRESFDVVCARAVARLNILSELCLPFVKVSGCFVAMKGAAAEEELAEAKAGIALLGGAIGEHRQFLLQTGDEPQHRSIILVQKQAKTPEKYPRNYGRINKKPL